MHTVFSTYPQVDNRQNGLKHYVYRHLRGTDGSVFYIGKGRGRRAYSTVGRSPYWRAITAKHGRAVEILEWFATDAEACAREIELIAQYRAAGARLCNLTLGGDGAAPTPEAVRDTWEAKVADLRQTYEAVKADRTAPARARRKAEAKAKRLLDRGVAKLEALPIPANVYRRLPTSAQIQQAVGL